MMCKGAEKKIDSNSMNLVHSVLKINRSIDIADLKVVHVHALTKNSHNPTNAVMLKLYIYIYIFTRTSASVPCSLSKT